MEDESKKYMLPEHKIGYHVDNVLISELSKVRYRVLKKDFDFVACIDGREGAGKSVLAMQIAGVLDPNFKLDNIVFTSDEFMKKIKDPKTKKGTCIILDEAFNAANSRASMTEVNRSMGAVATEMRQKNLFILIVLPSFFDLDKQFAIHRCSSLIHVYLKNSVDRGYYVIFPRSQKLLLYINGKRTYNYSKPKSPYPPCRFYNHYVVDENEYRLKKSLAFKKRTVSNQARKWLMQRDSYIKYVYKTIGLTQEELSKIPTNYGVEPIGQRQISNCLKDFEAEQA